MLFGDPNDFAIEVMLEPNLVPPSPAWGRMCVHVERYVLGDYTEPHCGLMDADAGLRHLRDRIDALWDDAFESKSAAHVHELVCHAIYGDDSRTLDEVRQDFARFGRFDFLTNWGEPFNRAGSVIFRESPDRLRVTHRPSPDMLVSVSCTVVGFVNACDQFASWLDTERKRLLRG